MMIMMRRSPPLPPSATSAVSPGEGVLTQAMGMGPAERLLPWVVAAGEIKCLLSVVLL